MGSFLALAQDASDELNELQDEISAREAQIDSINRRIDEYRTKIDQYSSAAASLSNDLAMIENQTAIAELDIQATEAEIETQELQIQVLEEAIKEQEAQIDVQKEILEEMVFEIHKNDGIGFIEVLFGAGDFNELFSAVEHLETVNADMQDALDATQETKAELTSNKSSQEDRLDQLIELGDQLELQIANFESQLSAKEVLLDQTEASESEYRVLMSELRQEQAYITQQISALQSEIAGKISDLDELGDATIFTWPVDGIITALFHDPTYPFRHLFEHGGLDVAAPTGTPIASAAPGYVAWARTGRSYGNYVMVIHADGYATLYAHMSSIAVEVDQFVARGQVLGYVGSTGLSTGPHLHFEIRDNGIPVDPLLYLTSY